MSERCASGPGGHPGFRRGTVLALALLVSVLAGCGRRGGAPPPAEPPGQAAGSIVIPPAVDRATRADLARAIAEFEQGGVPGDSLVALLGEAGYLRARLCRDPEGRWTVLPGPRTARADCRWLAADSASGFAAPQGRAGRVAAGAGKRADVDQVMEQMLASCGDEGFPLAELELADFHGDSLLTLETRLRPGPRVQVTSLEFDGQRVSRPAFLRRVAGWQEAEWYRGERWRGARERLWATGLFQEVRGPYLLLDEAFEQARAESLKAGLLFRLTERPASAVSGLIAYSDRGQAGSSGRWTGFLDLSLGNILGTGRATRIFWQSWGEQRSTFEFSWHEPFLWRVPLGADASLRHVQEDTLYAETTWGADLLWRPAPLWEIGAGWGRTRLVLGEPLGHSLHRTQTRFRVTYQGLPREQRASGWALKGELVQANGEGSSERRLHLKVSEWLGRSWRLELEQDAGVLAGADTLLRGDAFVLGGSGSLRGSAEGEYRAVGYALQRVEYGPRIDARGSRLYVLADGAWLEEWTPGVSLLYGSRGRRIWRWAAGLGVEVPGRAGRVRLEYAVAGTESLWRGRLHFAVVGAF
jgi:hypothetical protein